MKISSSYIHNICKKYKTVTYKIFQQYVVVQKTVVLMNSTVIVKSEKRLLYQ